MVPMTRPLLMRLFMQPRPLQTFMTQRIIMKIPLTVANKTMEKILSLFVLIGLLSFGGCEVYEGPAPYYYQSHFQSYPYNNLYYDTFSDPYYDSFYDPFYHPFPNRSYAPHISRPTPLYQPSIVNARPRPPHQHRHMHQSQRRRQPYPQPQAQSQTQHHKHHKRRK